MLEEEKKSLRERSDLEGGLGAKFEYELHTLLPQSLGSKGFAQGTARRLGDKKLERCYRE